MIKNIIKELKKSADPKKAAVLKRFFKTGKGEYGEGDKFLGVIVPEQRKIAKKYSESSINDLQKLLDSEIHEYRLTALLILVDIYPQSPKKIVNFYLKNTKNINNWDLVDLSAPNIVGDYFLDKDRKMLRQLAKSKNLWERRIAMVATYAFIKRSQFADTIKIAGMLLGDSHDLIHKAVGWMLREVGKRDKKILLNFLDKNAARMPRTMLRYAIEKLPEKKRKKYLKKEFLPFSKGRLRGVMKLT
ncbi:MAG: DNA alkylation repair protein [Patescibacteria group bacterium]